ncbi:MAG: glutathione S-transferase family protein [Pseudomonadales bacterium]
MITLHQFALSPFSDKIIRILHFKGLHYRIQEYPLMSKAVKRVNPIGKLPCLEDNGQLIADSTDIAYHLEQQYPQRSVIPEESAQQAMVHVLEDWADESLYYYEMQMRFGLPENGQHNIPRMLVNNRGLSHWFLSKVLPKGILSVTKNQGVGKKSIKQLVIDIDRHFIAVDKLLINSDWLVGSQLTLADLAVFSMFNCLKDAEQALACLLQYPRIEAWMNDVRELTDEPVE